MKAADLRQSILQMAAQGKLVPQNLHDEPASELLARIKTEKAKLIKEGKLKKEKPLPPIAEDEIPYDLPDGWVWCRLNELVIKVGSGSTPYGGRKVYLESGVKFLRSQNVYNDGLRLDNVAYIAPAIHEKMLGTWVSPKDILLNITGASIGRCCLVSDAFDSGNVNQHVSIIRCASPEIRFYLHMFLTSPYLQKNIMEQQVGMSREGLSGEKIKRFIIPIPPLAEQQRIVAKVDELMAMCDELEAAEEELDALESHFIEYLPKSILQAAVEGKLVSQSLHDEPASELLARIKADKAKLIKEGKLKKEKPLPPIAEDEIPYDLPDGWVWCRLGDLVQLINGDRGKNYPSKDKLSVSGIPFISAINISGGSISTAKLLCVNQAQYDALGSGKLQKNDIVFCIRGSLGKCGIYPFEQGAIASSLVILRRYLFDDLCLDYLMYYLSTSLLDNEIRKYNNGTAQPNLSAENLKAFLFPLPPLAEQQRIVAKVDELMSLCDELKSAKTAPIVHDMAKVIQFPQTAKPVTEIGIAARGSMRDLSDEAMCDIDELFGDDTND